MVLTSVFVAVEAARASGTLSIRASTKAAIAKA